MSYVGNRNDWTSTEGSGLENVEGDEDYEALNDENYGESEELPIIPFHIEMDKSPPHSPMALSAYNTGIWAHLSWIPQYNNGLVQYFRIKFNPVLDRDDVRYFDVYPGDTNSTRLKLRLGMSYEISIMAFNDLGESPYSEAVTLNMSEYSGKEKICF